MTYRYVPEGLRSPTAFATFQRELVNAVTCCEAVEQAEWNALKAQEVINKARKRKGRATLKAVSLPSEPSCEQRFMVFEAEEGDHKTYIFAFRSRDSECYNDIVSKPVPFTEVDDTFKVHQSLLSPAVSMPLQPLPFEWHSGLHHPRAERRHRLLLTGFSVGGAVAALATLRLLEAEYDLKDQICCYTFGAPLQGDHKYASYINDKHASNFYHVIMAGDSIPNVLTLVSKVAESKPNDCKKVARQICLVLAATAQAATGVAVNAVAPFAGTVLQQFNLIDLVTEIRSLVKAEHRSRMALPEYKFGGSLVMLDSTRQGQDYQMNFCEDRVLGGLDDKFSVKEKECTIHPRREGSDGVLGILLHQIKSFCQVINDLDFSHISRELGILPAEAQWVNRSYIDPTIAVINVDGAVGVAELPSPNFLDTMSSISLAARAPEMRHFGTAKDQSSPLNRDFLVPRFDDKPIQVWLDRHENITIEVNGDNMALGLHVLYKLNGEEKLRIPVCTECTPPNFVENSEDPQFSRLPLQFRTQGTKGLSFQEPDGEFIVQLAFGHTTVPARAVDVRMFDALGELKVAERFSTEEPKKLLDLVAFWGMAAAQAQCTAAFYAIQENPHCQVKSDDIVSKTLGELRKVPAAFGLLDRLLILIDTAQLPRHVLEMLPEDMSSTLRNVTSDASDQSTIVHCFSTDNESVEWTFSGCYTRIIEQVVNKKMLSSKETAELLLKKLEAEFAGPKQVLSHYVDHEVEFKKYSKSFSLKNIKKWEDEKEKVKFTSMVVGAGASALPLAIYFTGVAYDQDFLKAFGAICGIPPAALAVGMYGSAWCLYHVFTSPVRRYKNIPGLMAECLSQTLKASDWEKKLQAAALLFRCQTTPPRLACRWEFDLNKSLKQTSKRLRGDRFTDLPHVKREISESSYGIATILRLANYGLAGARMYDIRRYLTDRTTSLGLIGSTQAGKSTFCSQAFGVDSQYGTGIDARTRVLRFWTLPLPEQKYRQFTVIDFPGSTDHAAKDWYIDGKLLASVLVVVLNLKEMNSDHCMTHVLEACRIKSTSDEACILFCFTHADEMYKTNKEEAKRKDGDITAADIFTKNFEDYKKEIKRNAARKDTRFPVDSAQLDYVVYNMQACCFEPKYQDGTKRLAQELKTVQVKNVEWVRDWCHSKLLTINRAPSSGSELSLELLNDH